MLRKVPALLLALLLATGLAWAQGEDPPPAESAETGETAETAEEAALVGEVEAEITASTVSSTLGDGMVAPGNIVVADYPNDAGDGLLLYFDPGSEADNENFAGYAIYRRTLGEEELLLVGTIDADEGAEFVDGYDPDFIVEPGVQYEYQVAAMYLNGAEVPSDPVTAQEVASGQIYHAGKTRVLVGCVLFLGLILFYFHAAQRGVEMYLRPIAGIEAIDEAIGRATEMGKPILYVPGLSTISDVATIASITILGRVAKKVAEYGTPLLVPNRDPIVYTIAEETVKQAYMEAGRPDAFDKDSVFFLTQSQFAFVAGVNGIMMREKPATNFYLGMFWAESLILAETGSLSGAIQIAGTDAVTQLPFFITTCDYTLIGEELYAASAYLGREPKQLGSIKGQDACKGIIMAVITLGLLLALTDIIAGTETLDWLKSVVTMPIVD
ncbi:MAG: fibronectin type III domain-containing protein [Candidatus Sabulitectum sp.]|nr:fibronectin type III domain-containing protein [Candidatus Sabulitectum sp.]